MIATITPGAWGGLLMLVAIFAVACGVVGRLAWIVFSALRSVRPEVCDECGHAAHKGVCGVEMGDRDESGFATFARGQCDCEGK